VKKNIIGIFFLVTYYLFSLILITSSEYLIRIMCYILLIMSIIGILVIMLYKGKIIGLIICYSLWTFLSVLISIFISIIADQKYSSTFLVSIIKAPPIFFRFLLANDLFIIFILLVTIAYNIPIFLIVKKIKNTKRW
jgi:hypothetical protein